MKVKIFEREEIGIYCFFLVTNDCYSRSSSVDELSINDEEHYTQKRKPRRAKSIVKSSVEKMLDTNSINNTRRNSTTSIADKRPFPFGQW